MRAQAILECIVSIEAIDDYTVKVTFNYDPGCQGWQYGAAVAPAMPGTTGHNLLQQEDLLAVDGLDAPAGAFLYDKVEQGAFATWKYDADTMYFGGETTIYDQVLLLNKTMESLLKLMKLSVTQVEIRL